MYVHHTHIHSYWHVCTCYIYVHVTHMYMLHICTCYTYVHVYTKIRQHKSERFLRLLSHMSTHEYVHICIHSYKHKRTYIHTYMYTHVRTYVRTHVPTYIRTYMYIRTDVHICTYINTNVYEHIRKRVVEIGVTYLWECRWHQCLHELCCSLHDLYCSLQLVFDCTIRNIRRTLQYTTYTAAYCSRRPVVL